MSSTTRPTERVITAPSRRSLVRAAVWTAPAVSIAVAAPAYAACSKASAITGVIDWDGTGTAFSRSSAILGTSTLTKNGAEPLTVTAKAGYVGQMRAGDEFGGDTRSFTVEPNVGGLGMSGLRMLQSTTTPYATAENHGIYTFIFSRPVTGLQFTLTDIDSAQLDFWDVVQPSSGYTVVSKGANVSQDDLGLQGGTRFYNNGSNNALNDVTASSGNLEIRYPGQISTFSITYWNGAGQVSDTIDSNQNMYISDLSFSYNKC